MYCLCWCTVLLTELSLLIRADDYWWVDTDLGRKVGLLRAKVGEADLLLPPVQGWEYYDVGDGNYKSDAARCSREVSPASLDSVVKKKKEGGRIRRRIEEFIEFIL